MQPAYYELNVAQRADFGDTLTFTNDTGLVNFTGATAVLTIATDPGETALLVLRGGTGLTLGGALGTIAISMSEIQTALLTPDLNYDLYVTFSGGATLALAYGPVLLREALWDGT